MNFLLDPYIIALPPADCDEQRADDYVTTLWSWARQMQGRGHRFWPSDRIVGSLMKEKQYPTQQELKRLQPLLGEPAVLDVCTLLRACQPILADAPYLEERLSHVDVISTEMPTLLPEFVTRRLSDSVSEALGEVLAQAAFSKEEVGHELASSLLFITIPSEEEPDALSIRTRMMDDNHREISIESSWPMVNSPAQVDEMEGLCGFWDDVERALQWAMRDLRERRELPGDIGKPNKYTISANFLDSIQKHGWHNRPDLLAAIYRTAARAIHRWPRDGKAHKPLRTDAAPHAAQRTRAADSATAWRFRVCQGSLALRLHYWDIGGETIELSVIVPHEVFDIE